MKDKSKITLRGEAGRNEPDVEPGDVVFVLDCKPHKYFQRVNQVLQLFMIAHITQTVRPSWLVLLRHR